MIEITGLTKSFESQSGTVHALKDVSLTVRDGEIYGIIGMSGAGKSTLVRCINMLERPTSGTVSINGRDMAKLTDAELSLERRKIAMIFQGFNLLMQRNCLKNVMFPLELAKMPKREAEKRARELLSLVGLPDKAGAFPSELSGGQRQRVAIARALATEPEVLLSDEATSALDPNTTHSILALIRDINRKLGITVIMITHQMSVVEEVCDRVAILDEGTVAEEGEVGTVFSSPKSAAAKRLVFPSGEDELVSDPSVERRLRIVFKGGRASGTPLIATMARDEGVMANILAGTTRTANGEVYGSLLLGIPESGGQMERAKAYLSSIENVFIEEITPVRNSGDIKDVYEGSVN